MNKADRRFQERSRQNALQDREASRREMLEKVGLKEPDPTLEDFAQEMGVIAENLAKTFETFGKALEEFGESVLAYARRVRLMDLAYNEEYEDEYDELYSIMEDITDDEREAECIFTP